MTVSLRCRYCGRPCKKRSQARYFGSRDDLQRLVNGIIIQTRWAEDAEGRYVERAMIWDGESYLDKFFCSDSCAAAMGRSVSRDHGFVTKAYEAAMKKVRRS